MAAPVMCSAWILIMSRMVMGRQSQLNRGLKAEAVVQRGSFRRNGVPTTTKRAQLGPSPQRRSYPMRFYNTQHPYYCGIDLHARRATVLRPSNPKLMSERSDATGWCQRSVDRAQDRPTIRNEHHKQTQHAAHDDRCNLTVLDMHPNEHKAFDC